MRAGPREALAAVLLVVLATLALARAPATAEAFDEHVAAPLRAQAGVGAGTPGYSPLSLAYWSLSGLALASAAYVGLLRPLRVAWDARLAVTLAPYLALGPLLHALMAAGAWRPGAWAVVAAEPLVYVTMGALAALGLVLGAAAERATGRPAARAAAPAALGVALLLALVPATLAAARGGHGAVALGLLGAAAVVGLAALGAGRALAPRWRDLAALAAWPGAAVVAAHALDGLSTWVVLRDPFGWSLPAFAEKNPLSAVLVEAGSGVLFPVVKVLLAAGLAVYVWRATDAAEDRPLRGPFLLALFVLGWGPGAANLAVVAFA